jgi:hypothetical protein
MSKFYILRQPNSPWGDYSDILTHGMATRADEEGALLHLERTGPFVPALTFPGLSEIVVTEAFRKQLESSGLAGLHFEPVVKERIVHLDWHLWDMSADDMLDKTPESGEPEDYILTKTHSQTVSDMMGDLWSIKLSETATVRREGRPTRILLEASSWHGDDIFGAVSVGYIYVTEKARAWFELHAPKLVAFKDVEVV